MKNKKLSGHIALFATNIIFGLNMPLSRSLIPAELSPYTLTFLRMGGGLLLFWVVSLFIKKEKVPPRDILLFFFASLFALVLNQIPFIVGLSMTSPVDASIVITLLPVISMFLAALILKEPITFMKAIGVVTGASGALLLIFSNYDAIGGNGNLAGNLIILISSFSYALYLTVFKKLILRYSPVTSMKWMFLFATVMSFPVCFRALSATDFYALSGNVYWRVAFVVIFATFITYLLIPVGQKVLRPTTLSMYNYLQPIVASLVAVALGMDRFGSVKIVSGILVFLGVYLVNRSKSRQQMEAEKLKNGI